MRKWYAAIGLTILFLAGVALYVQPLSPLGPPDQYGTTVQPQSPLGPPDQY